MILVLTIMGITGCKPTEKNYKSAYDAAKAKRDAEATDPDMELMLNGHKLDTSEGGNALVDNAGNSYPQKALSLVFENEPDGTGDYFLSVSTFSMPTNALALAYDMDAKGDTVTVARDANSNWYVIAGRNEDRVSAAGAASRFVKSHPGFQFIGQDNKPLILVSGTR